jgi:hypothetical protein
MINRQYKVEKNWSTVEALDSVLGGRHVPINVGTSRLIKTCILPVLSYGCEIYGMDSTRGVSRLQTT